jgi:UDP-N-acetylglucosamine 2-epimerase (non-hydrolysing)
LEAGLRSGDRHMPEEINRLMTDAICDLLWTPSPDADENLRAEGVPAERIERVGNIMIDSFEMVRSQIESDRTRESMNLDKRNYVVVTLHRPSNVDDRDTLSMLVRQLIQIAESTQLVFAVHPRTRKRLGEFELLQPLLDCPRIRLTEPLGYIQFMNLVSNARAVITDSGGVQEETTYLGIPCMTLRENTERPVTVTQGSNRLVKPEDMLVRFADVLTDHWPTGTKPDLWDGRTATRCVESLRIHCSK